jgi:hypothetical protein
MIRQCWESQRLFQAVVEEGSDRHESHENKRLVAPGFPGHLKRLPPEVAISQGGGVRLLRATISASQGWLREAVASKAEEAGAMMGQLAMLRDPQAELLLLRSCGGICKLVMLRDPQAELLLLWSCAWICKLMHVLRCFTPAVVDRGVAIFDEFLRDSLRRIAVRGGGGWGVVALALSNFC